MSVCVCVCGTKTHVAVGVHVVVPVRLCALAADDVFAEQRDVVHPDLPVAGLGAATNPAEEASGVPKLMEL